MGHREENPSMGAWGSGTNTAEMCQLQAEFGLSSRATDLMDGLKVSVMIDCVGKACGEMGPESSPAYLRAMAIYLAELESQLPDLRSG